MLTEENKNLVQRWNDEVWCKRNLDAIDELMATNFIFNWAAPGMPSDRDGYKKAVTAQFAAFPDLCVTIDELTSEGDKVTACWTGNSTHKGKFMGIALTGKRLNITGLSIFRIVGDKIVEEWTKLDMLRTMQPLLMFPPPP